MRSFFYGCPCSTPPTVNSGKPCSRRNIFTYPVAVAAYRSRNADCVPSVAILYRVCLLGCDMGNSLLSGSCKATMLTALH